MATVAVAAGIFRPCGMCRRMEAGERYVVIGRLDSGNKIIKKLKLCPQIKLYTQYLKINRLIPLFLVRNFCFGVFLTSTQNARTW